MREFFWRVWSDLVGRTEGPMKYRLLAQPLSAIIMAIFAGLRDARENKPPFFWSIAFHPEFRGEMLKQGWKDIGKVFLIACALDVVYQVIALRTVWPGEAIVVATLLAVIPYVFVRATTGRILKITKGRS